MRSDDYTEMGGVGEAFLTTHWSLIEDIDTSDDTRNQALVSLLLKKYWKPVYCYLRRKGYDNEQAKDLTQGFFHEVVLGRDLIQKANQSKGRFRTLLLTALSRYLISAREYETARKRIPQRKLISLDLIDPPELSKSISKSTPEDAFNYAWASSLVEQVLHEVETTCRDQGQAVYWLVFQNRVLQPIMERTNPPSIGEICRRYGIQDGIKASSMILTVKRRFRATLKKYLRNSVTSDEEEVDELREIMQFFPKSMLYRE
jgi:DNA-directed RNA polymerase specialized sigma24 family protein